ncbi:MAG TPA: universal stress protein [Chlorobaculum sp.]|jgi:nucleotide-binding universal stress UspA family protein|uniref:Universal stress protein family n=1 Tax=Chlorobaculum tepidum (strain ATCC 49652 / DSM 12025 / NBRC 103806 / TLS) TaxID=194439 RepID=Q8KE92_CHLTE|nr:universal stress protein [Chlorobaculum tepidum]AAM72034.1 universal stress protein family [Chlorobaculum tepidum TLS]HBU22953.1 universal stress protein [Chlorobaculum sp.]
MITIKSILCPMDFSDASKKAYRYACEFAKSMGSKLILLNVIEPRPIAADMTLNYVPLEEDLAAAAREDFVPMVDEAKAAGIDVSADVIIGIPAEVILQKTLDFDVSLVIMGSHGRTGLSRLLMGSVAEAVVRKAQVPVLIVKAQEKEFISKE